MKDLTDEFEFEQWAEMAAADPQGFEVARARVLESLIASAPAASRRRLRGLQWQVERIREQASNPMSSCLQISELMWDKVLGNDGLIEHVEQLTGARQRPTAPRNSAVVLAFERPSRLN